MDIYTIVEYVMNTPYNTNRAILEDMLYEYTEEIYSGGGEIEEITVLDKQTDGETIFYRIDDTTLSPSNIFILDNGYLLKILPKGRYFISSDEKIYNWEFDSVESAFLMTPLSSSQEKKYKATKYTREDVASLINQNNKIYKIQTGTAISNIKSNMDFLTNIGFDIRDNINTYSYIYKIGVTQNAFDDIDIEDAMSPEKFYSNFNTNQVTGFVTLFITTGDSTQPGLSLYTYYYGMKENQR